MAFKMKKNQTPNKPSNDKTKPKKKITRRHIVNSICILFLSSVLIVSLVCFVLLQNILASSNQLNGKLTADNSTRLYDRNGTLITTLAGEDGIRENITYDQVPQSVIDAFLSIEDSRFFIHNGFDLPRFIKSAYENILTGTLGQGGSTLTMQLIDVSNPNYDSLTAPASEKIKQKVLEIFKSIEIEEEMSKEEIIEYYLNKVNFGGAARGIQKGSEYYFNKNVEQLNLSEAAFLAGIVNAPGYYNPYSEVDINEEGVVSVNHYDEAVKRRNATLELMLYHGYITKDEYEMTSASELAFSLTGEKRFSVEEYKSYVNYAVKEVYEKTGIDPATNPMDIYTNMDMNAQTYADAICNETAQYSAKEGIFNISEQYNDRYQAAFALMNKKGEILALGNGFGEDENKARSWHGEMEYGSTVKPILDYGPAIEELGWSDSHVVPDEPMAYATSVLNNADGTFHGDMNIPKALEWSYNVPAYYTLLQVEKEIGVEGVQDYLRKLGFSDRIINQYRPAYAIGGADFKGSPLELASAYQPLMNNGERIEKYAVSRVVFKDGSEDYVASQEPQRVYSNGTAWIMTNLLAQVVDAQITDVKTLAHSGYRIYGKSGTTHYDESAINEYGYDYNGKAKDEWVVGFTDEYIVASWAGYDSGSSTERNYLTPDEMFAWNLSGDISRTMLDVVTNYGEKASKSIIPMPDDVATIKHVAGTFPYASASGDVSSDLIVTGHILKRYAKVLEVIKPDPLQVPTDFTMALTGNELDFTLAEYPDKDKLKVAEKTKVVSAGGVSATVTKIFDKSFLYGAVVYQVDIELNGNKITTLTPVDGKGIFNQWGKELENGDTIKACGYYKYANTTDEMTAKKCQDLVASGIEKTYTIDSTFSELFDGKSSYNLTKVKIDNYMSAHYSDVIYEVLPSPTIKVGTLDTTQSTLQSDTKVDTKTKYYIYVGTKND